MRTSTLYLYCVCFGLFTSSVMCCVEYGEDNCLPYDTDPLSAVILPSAQLNSDCFPSKQLLMKNVLQTNIKMNRFGNKEVSINELGLHFRYIFRSRLVIEFAFGAERKHEE